MGKHLIKRVIGVSGDKVKIHNGKVFLNDIEINEELVVSSDIVYTCEYDLEQICVHATSGKDDLSFAWSNGSDKECIEAFFELSRLEGIIPALEPSHALAVLKKIAKNIYHFLN